jgi:uncharacterized membrane protein YsdA (DUF1294 family)
MLLTFALFYTALISLLTFLVWAYDKLQARLHRRRISERTLLTLTFLGGSYGAALALLLLRHKTRKPRLVSAVTAALLLHTALLFWVALTF